MYVKKYLKIACYKNNRINTDVQKNTETPKNVQFFFKITWIKERHQRMTVTIDRNYEN